MLLTRADEREAVYGLVSSQASREGFDEIIVKDITEQTGMMGIYGPEAFASVSKILPMDIGELTVGRMMSISFFMITVTLLRGSWVGLDGVELICPSSVGPMAAGAVAKYHKKANITPAGMECLEKAIRAGITGP
jgi:glycine cleavage system aminomethyltransferase T